MFSNFICFLVTSKVPFYTKPSCKLVLKSVYNMGLFYLLGNGIKEYVDILAVAKAELFPHVEPCEDPGTEEQEGWEDDDECEEGHPGVPGERQEDGPDSTNVAARVGDED